MNAKPVFDSDGPSDKMVAMNEALVLGSLRQHELTEAADAANELLRREIEERKQVEEALRHAQNRLKHRAVHLEALVAERTAELTATNRQLEDFAYSIAHDLRAPLRAMQGFSSALVEEAGEGLSASGRDFARRIARSAQFMDALLQGLLAFSRIAQQEITLTTVNLESIVRAAVSRLDMEIQQSKSRVEIAGPWPAVIAHEATVGKVLENLVGNALKFTRQYEQPKIRVHAEDRGLWVRVWVEDNGIGVPPDYQEQIFRLFAKLQGEQFPGTGVGLAIVRKCVERMGGCVGVESIPGRGSCFWFELPKPEAP